MAKLDARFLPPEVTGTTFYTVEVDFGTTPLYSLKVTVNHVGALVTQKVMIVQSGAAATGRAVDENEMDAIIGSGYVSASGVITLFLHAVPGPVTGKYNVNYLIG
jgi:hypothetical protein